MTAVKSKPQPKPVNVKVHVKTVCAHCGSLLHQPKPELTDRQTRVLVMIAQGKTCAQIGEVLKISTRTAEFHRAMLMKTLRLHSSAELALYAAGQGLI